MILQIGFVILAVLSPCMVFLAYRQGVKDRARIDTGKPLEPLASRPHGRVVASREDRRYASLLDNIENYDGTGAGQKEVGA